MAGTELKDRLSELYDEIDDTEVEEVIETKPDTGLVQNDESDDETEVSKEIIDDTENKAVEDVDSPSDMPMVPVAELTKTRRKLRAKDNEYRDQSAKLSEAKEKIDWYEKQHKAHDIEISKTPESIDINEKINQLREDGFDDAADALEFQQGELDRLKKSQPAEPSEQTFVDENEIAEALESVPELLAWQQKGGDLWNKAIDLDSQYENDPAFKDMPMAERFEKVLSQVKSDVASGAKEKIAQQKQPVVPQSLGKTGGSATGVSTVAEQLRSGDASTVKVLSGMSQTERDELYEELDI